MTRLRKTRLLLIVPVCLLLCAAPRADGQSGAAPDEQAARPSFLQRFGQAYWSDWHPAPAASGAPADATGSTADAAPAFRGYPAPESDPPFPFTVWPIGGTVTIGQPFVISTPLMTAIYGGADGDWWKKSKIDVYGWVNAGFNFSTSSQANGKYGNAPAGYNQIPNSFQLDQIALYVERQPDTVQTDHIDWGFRLTQIYGLDYRFTTAKGYFSDQLLHVKSDGTLGNQYGYDPVMFYIDVYFPQVAQGMNLRMGRYISLPDIEAQLAPNNYTYMHSLTYTYDCYTQTGANATIKLSNHWTIQAGVSPGCDTAAWKPDAQWTGNACAAYTWSNGGDNVYLCANSINRSRYAYNNLAAYYITYYHKINEKWHTATESWYQYESHTPNSTNPAAIPSIQLNTNGAVCNNNTELTCFAPDYSILNYTNRQFGPHDFIGLRNEFFDDLRGQRTGYKTRYVEDGLSWNHWIGSTLLFRPELRWEHAFDANAYDTGHRHSQFMFAADVTAFF